MSFSESMDRLQGAQLELDSLDDRKKALHEQVITFKKEIVGELDRQMVMGLYRLGVELAHYDVDGHIWHRIPVVQVGTLIEKYPRSVVQVPRWDGHLVASHLIEVEVLDRLTLDKHPGHYDTDAWMLTDRRGHQIHTSHSYEGWHSAPHWHEGGWISLEEPERAIRDFMKRKRKGY